MDRKPKEYYKQRNHILQAQCDKLRSQGRWLGTLRLLTFIAIFPAVFMLTPKLPWAGITLSALLLILFVYQVKVNHRKNHMLQFFLRQLNILELEKKALGYDYRAFDGGEEFINTEHAFSYDMDLFGPGSVFQFINRTVTVRGKKLLANLLQFETLNDTEIKKRQEAVQELTAHPVVCHQFRASGQLKPDTEHDVSALSAWLNTPNHYSNSKAYQILITLLPYITTSIVVLAFFVSVLPAPAIMLFLTQLALVGRRIKHSSAQHNAITRQNNILEKYSSLLKVIEKKRYTSTYLTEVHATLLEGSHSASNAIKQLTKIVSAFDNRLNLLMGIFLQGLFLWDLQCVLRLERWKQNHRQYYEDWIHALARFDAITSLANFAFNFPTLSYPGFSESTIIEAENMGHVLLKPDECVTNNFKINKTGNFTIITGANMAGKSTFLRSVASNMILAMAGAPVCASVFIFKPMPLFSSMRTSDSLNKHESYFYAELKRLKELLDRIRMGEQLFIILDEILKGTNSVDKQKGSFAAMQQIIELQGTGIIATHDLELAKIENHYPEKVCNRCFEIEIDRAKITFDYKLRPGVTTKMNALLLMEQMGIIPLHPDKGIQNVVQ